jgi:hypothetical protein
MFVNSLKRPEIISSTIRKQKAKTILQHNTNRAFIPPSRFQYAGSMPHSE